MGMDELRHDSDLARISTAPPRSLLLRAGEWYSRRRFGVVLAPAYAMAHNPRVLRTMMRGELAAERWDTVPSALKTLAVMAAAGTVGCSWCMDFGYWHGIEEGLDAAKVCDLPRWQTSTAYTELERAAIAYAQAMSTTPPEVTDAHVERLREHLSEAQLVELTMVVAIENQRARFNTALGLPSQGFADRCALPQHEPGAA